MITANRRGMISRILVITMLFSSLSCAKSVKEEEKPDVPVREQIRTAFTEARDSGAGYTVIGEFAPAGEYEGIKAVTYENGTGKKVFAYYATPDNMTDDTPGVVLVHGGTGHAFLPWVKQWLDEGYAVMAPDITGYFPTAVNAGSDENSTDWERAMNGVFSDGNLSVMPDNDGFANSDKELDGQWMFHVLTALTKAYNIVSDNGARKCGIVGISWGAVVSTIYAEYDDRLSFLIPVYGSGYLSEARSYMGPIFSDPATDGIWGNGQYLGNIKCPVYWLCSNYDENFSVNSNSDSYLATMDIPGTRLAMIENFRHSHSSAWDRKEPLVFASMILSGSGEMPGFVSIPDGSSNECTVENAARARLYYITDGIEYAPREGDESGVTYPTEEWIRMPVTLSGDTVSWELPDDAAYYYISITGASLTVTTPVIAVKH